MSEFKEKFKRLLFLIKELDYTKKIDNYNDNDYVFRSYGIDFDCGKNSNTLSKIETEIENDIDNILDEIEESLKK